MNYLILEIKNFHIETWQNATCAWGNMIKLQDAIKNSWNYHGKVWLILIT